MPQETNDHNWRVMPHFDADSRVPYSSASGQVKREGDPGIVRPLRGLIDFEGFFDITWYDCEQLAQLIGWLPPTATVERDARIAELEAELEAIRSDVWKRAANAIAGARLKDGKDQKATSAP